ncbi:hypothetical protein RYX36_014754 [Vicia faba]
MEIRADAETSSFSSSLFAAVSYGFASMQLFTTLLIHFGRKMGYTRARGVDMETAKQLFPVSFFYNTNVAFALASLKGVNIPMYIAIKRLTPLAVLIAGCFMGKGRPTTQNNNNNLSLAYDVKDLLFEEGIEALSKKRTENLKKIEGLLVVNLERKRIRPDLVLRLQIEEKKLRLLDLQTRLRDEIEMERREEDEPVVEDMENKREHGEQQGDG